MLTRSTLFVLLYTAAAWCTEAVDDKWPQFRGPGGLGIGNDKASLPIRVRPDEGVALENRPAARPRIALHLGRPHLCHSFQLRRQ